MGAPLCPQKGAPLLCHAHILISTPWHLIQRVCLRPSRPPSKLQSLLWLGGSSGSLLWARPLAALSPVLTASRTDRRSGTPELAPSGLCAILITAQDPQGRSTVSQVRGLNRHLVAQGPGVVWSQAVLCARVLTARPSRPRARSRACTGQTKASPSREDAGTTHTEPAGEPAAIQARSRLLCSDCQRLPRGLTVSRPRISAAGPSLTSPLSSHLIHCTQKDQPSPGPPLGSLFRPQDLCTCSLSITYPKFSQGPSLISFWPLLRVTSPDRLPLSTWIWNSRSPSQGSTSFRDTLPAPPPHTHPVRRPITLSSPLEHKGGRAGLVPLTA